MNRANMARRTFLAGSSAAVCRAFYSMNSKQPAFYLDPNDFLSLFAAPGLVGATWSDPRFDAGLDWANATIEPALRMERLAGSEEFLMRSMPIIPLYCDSYSYLQKPFVRGLPMNPGNVPLFKYAWIDTHWRTS